MHLERDDKVSFKVLFLILAALCAHCERSQTSGVLNLPDDHLPPYFGNYLSVRQKCASNDNCIYKDYVSSKACWGYEKHCEENGKSLYSTPVCDLPDKPPTGSEESVRDAFYEQGDFGYVRRFRNSMEIICNPVDERSSYLECSTDISFCRGSEIRIDFSNLPHRKKPVIYDTDVLSSGQISGHCRLNASKIYSIGQHFSALQDWLPEISKFSGLIVSGGSSIKSDSKMFCDEVIEKPTYIMKIDATVNMYHHFCDFFNLYASLHVNSTSDNPESFSDDINVLIWRSVQYSSNFGKVFDAFTSNEIMDLRRFSGKKVCFKNVAFSLLPRMIYGLFYNTPLISGCQRSGLFKAFSSFILHRLRIPRRQVRTGPIRITYLSRKTKYRRVLNEDELISSINAYFSNVIVTKAAFTFQTDFEEQLRIIQDTDILIGMHGAGLTHLLFLPEWAVVFELYNCEDVHCYLDLARLKGVKYITWKNASALRMFTDESKSDKRDPKHINYEFQPSEFIQLCNEAVVHVMKKNAHHTSHTEL